MQNRFKVASHAEQILPCVFSLARSLLLQVFGAVFAIALLHPQPSLIPHDIFFRCSILAYFLRCSIPALFLLQTLHLQVISPAVIY